MERKEYLKKVRLSSRINRMVSMMLAVVMCLGLLPAIPVFADETSKEWDGTESMVLDDGDTLLITFSGDAEEGAVVTIPDNASVTLSRSVNYGEMIGSDHFDIGDNATIIFSDILSQYATNYIQCAFNVEGIAITLINACTGLSHYLMLDGTAESITLEGQYNSGFDINKTVRTQNFILKSGQHSIRLTDMLIDIADTDNHGGLILTDGGLLDLQSSLTELNIYATYSGSGITTLGSADVRLAFASKLSTNGGDSGPATSGDMDVYFINDTTEPSYNNGTYFYASNGNGYAGDSGQLTIHKAAGAFLTGDDWETSDDYSYSSGKYSKTDTTFEVKIAQNAPASFDYSMNRPRYLFFKASACGGAENITDSEAIKITFSQDVTNFPESAVTLDGAVGGTPYRDQDDKAIWYIPISSLTVDTVDVTISPFTDHDRYDSYELTYPSASVLVNRDITDEVSYRVEGVGGSDGTADSTGIRITFDQAVDGFSSHAISLSGASMTDSFEKVSDTVYTIGVTGFENKASVQVTIAGWRNNGRMYSPSSTENTALLYRDTRSSVTFSAQEYGGESEIADSQGIYLTFSEAISGLTNENITVSDATAGTLVKESPDGRVWKFPITDINSNTVTINIIGIDGINIVSTNVQVSVYRRIEKQVSFIAAQTGGTLDTVDSTGIIITFSEPVAGLPQNNITLDGATVSGAPVQDSDNGAVWTVPISDITQDKVSVTINGWLNYEVSESAVETNVYRKRMLIKFTATQYGGREGTVDTTHILVTFKNESDEVIEIESFPQSVVKITAYSSNVAGTPVLKEGSTTEWLIPVSSLVEDQQAMSIRINNWDNYKLEKNNSGDFRIYTRHYVERTFTVKTYTDSGAGKPGIEDTKQIYLEFNEPVIGLTADMIMVTGAKVQAVYGQNDIYYYFYITDITHEGNATVSITDFAGPQCYYTFSSDSADVVLYKDLREVIACTAEQIGGEADISDTTGIKLTFSKELQNLTSDNIILAYDYITKDGWDTIEVVHTVEGSGKYWTIHFNDIQALKSGFMYVEIKDNENYKIEIPEEGKVNVYESDRGITYTAVADGSDGIEDSKNITLTFDKPVQNLTADHIELRDATLESVTGSGTQWIVKLASVSVKNGEKIGIHVYNMDDYTVKTEPTEVVIYKSSRNITFTAKQVIGEDFGENISAIDIQLSAPITDVVLSDRNIHLYVTNNEYEYESNYYQIAGDPTKWRVTFDSSGIADNAKLLIYVFFDDENSEFYIESVEVAVDYDNLERTFTAVQTGGTTKTTDSTGLKLSFSRPVFGLRAEDITLTGAEIDSVSMADESGYNWNVTIRDITAKNGGNVSVEIDDFKGIKVLTASADVVVYRALKMISFYAAQLNGVDKVADTTGFKLNFSDPVPGLAKEDVQLIGATVASVEQADDEGKVWVVQLDTLNRKNGEYVSITVSDSSGYNVPIKVDIRIYVKDRTVSFVVSQIGGIGEVQDTQGILLRFNKPVTSPAEVLTVTGVSVGELTDFGDGDASTWYLPLAGEFDDNMRIAVIIEDYGDYDIIKNTQYLNIYKDLRVHFTYTVEQYGGKNGVADSVGFYITVTPVDPSTNVTGFSSKIIQYTGAVTQSDVTKVSSISGSKNASLITTKLKSDWNNGDKVTVTFNEWTYKGITYTPDNTQEVALFKDTRDHVNIKYAYTSGGLTGKKDTEIIVIGFDRDVKNFTSDAITIVTPEGESVTLGEATRRSVGHWVVPILSVDLTAPKNDYKIIINDWDNYAFDRSWFMIQICSDVRETAKLLSVETIGGASNTADTAGILLTFDKEFYDAIFDSSQLNVSVTSESGSIKFNTTRTNYPVEKNQVYLEIKNWDYFDNTNFTVSLKDIRSSSVQYHIEPATDEVFLMRAPVAEKVDGVIRSLKSVNPYAINLNSKKQYLTLGGELGGNVKALTSVRIRSFAESDSSKWVSLGVSEKYSRNSYSLSVDVSHVSLLNKVGKYEIQFVSEDGFISEWRTFDVTEELIYSQDGYGILAVTQDTNGKFTVKGFEGETAMNEALNGIKPILVFRGEILDIDGEYLVKTGTAINKVLTFADDTGANAIHVKKLDNGNLSIKAAGGRLEWKGITITGSILGNDDAFTITLDQSKRYKTSRTSGEGVPMEIVTGINDFNVDFVVGKVELATYKLYDGECAISGGIALNAPEMLLGSIGAGFDLEQMVLDGNNIPGIKANGYLNFEPGGLIGGSIGDLIGGGSFEFMMDTLPETADKTISASGELQLADLIYVRGELVLKGGTVKGTFVYLPETISFFGRVGTGGVPLVPPVVVAYLNGIGGSIDGLASTIYGNFKYVPPVTLSLSGALQDATGELIEVNEATFKIGVASYSAYANEAKIFKFITLKDVGFDFGMTDSETPSQIGIYTTDMYLNFGGSVSFALPQNNPRFRLEGGMKVGLKIYGNKISDSVYNWMTEINNSGGFVKPSQKVKDNLKQIVGVNARAWGKAELNLGKLGWHGAYLELAGSNKKLSASTTFDLWLFDLTVGIEYDIPNKDVDFIFNRMAIPDGSDSPDEENLSITNLVDAGLYRPQVLKAAARMARLTDNTPLTASAGNIATLFSDEKAAFITVYKDGEEYEVVSLSDENWFDTYTGTDSEGTAYTELGAYSLNYLIAEDGVYTFVVSGTECAYDLTEVLPIPGLSSVSPSQVNNESRVKIDWIIDEVAENYENDLYIKHLLMDATTGDILSDLTMPQDDAAYPDAKALNTLTAAISGTVESGEYYISSELMKKNDDGDYVTLRIFDSEVFSYLNPDALPAPAAVEADYIGNGAFEVTWNAVDSADGYIVSILDENGNEIPGISAVDVTANVTSTVVQGGTFIGGNGVSVGLDFDRDYTIMVRAYKNRTTMIASGDDRIETLVRQLGNSAMADFTLDTPVIPELTVSFDDAIKAGDNDGGYYAINRHDPVLEVHADTASIFRVYRDNDTDPVYTSESAEFSHSIPLSYESDGYYSLRITAEAGIESTEMYAGIQLDTVSPVLNIDARSFFTTGGAIQINGYTELGATVTLNSEQLDVNGGLFSYSSEVNTGLYRIVASDEAGNTTEREIYVTEDWRYHTVTFDSNGGSAVSSVNVYDGDSVVKPSDPVRNGYRFEGWYTDRSFVTSYNFADAVRSDIMVYAKWSSSSVIIPIPDPGTDPVEPTIPETPDEPGLPKIVFDDVNAGDWYYDDVTYIVGLGLFNGVGDKTFDPNGTMTRAMLATVMYRFAAPMAEYDANGFDDVERNKWYTDAIDWICASGIMNGIGGQKFAPNAQITREQMAVILLRFLVYTDIAIPVTEDYIKFADDDSISDYAKDAMQLMYKLGIIQGRGNTEDGAMIAPKDAATRAEVAVMLRRFIERIK